jgi:hypothetical protein
MALRDYYQEGAEEETPGTPGKKRSPDDWALVYLGVSRLQSISEAFDDDASGEFSKKTLDTRVYISNSCLRFRDGTILKRILPLRRLKTPFSGRRSKYLHYFPPSRLEVRSLMVLSTSTDHLFISLPHWCAFWAVGM